MIVTVPVRTAAVPWGSAGVNLAVWTMLSSQGMMLPVKLTADG